MINIRRIQFISILFKRRSYCINQTACKQSLANRFHLYLNKNNDQKSSQMLSRKIEELCQESSLDYEINLVQQSKLLDKKFLMLTNKKYNSKELFEALDTIFRFLPKSFVQLNFFHQTIRTLIVSKHVSTEDFVKLCHYLGFFKKHDQGPKYLKELLDEGLDKMLMNNQLNRMDLAILCTASYKTSVRISNNKFHEKIIDEICKTCDNDSYIFVAFIKSLRQNQIYSQRIIEKLKSMFLQSELFNYESLIHILPYVADNNLKEDELIQSICKRCIKTFDNNSRVKDIQKFLHSCALLNLSLNNYELKKLEDLILNRVSNDEFETHFDHFINATLSLWMLNYKSKSLVELLLRDKRFYNTGLKTRIKLDSRKKLLETCVEIEEIEWLKKIKRKTIFEKSFNETRPSPGYLIKSSLEKAINEILGDKKIKIVQQIRNLNIAGVYEIDENIHYEILDKSTCLSDGQTPNGFFQLKLRLLAQQNCKVKVISLV